MSSDRTDRATQDETPASAADREGFDTLALEAVTAGRLPRITSDTRTPPHGCTADCDAYQADNDDAMIGRRLGAYQLVSRIGAGGLGSVYLATRVEDFEQQVAVTLFKRGMDSESIVRRFRTEINVQAALGKHANIAGLLDAGTAADGRPYFVMEYVDGQRIDDYCDTRRLDTPARLHLFEQVCDAVQFAHQHAVIHRDLKPSNIVVTAAGVPKLIGFGIAKVVDVASGGTNAGGGLTGTGELVLTPEYASPEQIHGEAVTTASDVYALGVVLYRLLTGRRPYRPGGQTTSDIFQAICEQAPERPSLAVVRRFMPKARAALPNALRESTPAETMTSTAPASADEPPETAASAAPPAAETAPEELALARGTSPSGLSRVLAGDLDMIVLTALRKEPDRRYASPALLADDLRRHLDGRPVAARADSTVYRLGKFVRQHAAVVAAAAAVVVALIAAVAVTTTGVVLVRRERDRAEASSRQARQAVDQFFTRVSEERLLNQPGLHTIRKELLADAQRFYERFVADEAGDPALRADLARARSRLARISAEIGSLAEATQGFEQAIALWDELVRAHPPNADYRFEQARGLNDLAAVLLRQPDHLDEAGDACGRARALIEPMAAAPGASARTREQLASVLQNIVTIQFQQGELADAAETLDRVLTIVGKLTAEDPRRLEPQIALAQAYHLMGQIQSGLPDGMDRAIEARQQGIEIRDAIHQAHPELADQAHGLAMDLGELGMLEQVAGKLDSALASLRRAIQVLERLDRQFPGVLDYTGGLAATYNMMSDLHRRRLEPAESLAWGEKARSRLERLLADHAEDIDTRLDLAKSHNNIARIRQQFGETAEALRSFKRAVDIYEGMPQLDGRNSYNLACNLALCIPLIGVKAGSHGDLDPEAVSKADRLRRQVYSDRAIDVLRQALRRGFGNGEVFESDPDLAAIRGRDEFQQILQEAENQATADPT